MKIYFEERLNEVLEQPKMFASTREGALIYAELCLEVLLKCDRHDMDSQLFVSQGKHEYMSEHFGKRFVLSDIEELTDDEFYNHLNQMIDYIYNKFESEVC